jgi:glycosyltransferase involved in cell wall biosynthesis
MLHEPDMFSNRPQLSVVIPCYNQTEYLRECLTSLIAQDIREWEGIVVDDHSTKGDVQATVDSFRDPRLHVVRHSKNKGLAAARNTGFHLAQGELVLPIDSDDCLEPSFLRVTSHVFIEIPQVDCVFTDLQCFGDSNEIWHYRVMTPRDMLKTQWIPGPGTLMRKRVWKSVGGYSEAPEFRHGNEDWDFWISAVKLGICTHHIPLPLYLYRRSSNSMSKSLKRYDYVTRNTIYRRHSEFFCQYNAGKAFKAVGYFNSATAAAHFGETLDAIVFALCSLILSPENKEAYKLMLRVVLPHCFIERFKAKLRNRKAFKMLAVHHPARHIPLD